MWQKVFENDAFCGIMHETAAEQKESRSPEAPADIVILFILMSADTVIMRFEGTDYSKFDYTWTVQDRQAITDIIDLYNLLKAVTPEVREKALRN